MNAMLKRVTALILAVLMLIGMAGCAKTPGSQPTDAAGEEPPVQIQMPDEVPAVDEERETLEQMADLLQSSSGDTGRPPVEELDDQELEELITDLLEQAVEKEPQTGGSQDGYVNVKDHEDDYSDEGELNKPFDQIYPDLVEDEKVEYSDESLLVKLSNSNGGVITDGMKAAGVAALEVVVPMEVATWYEAKLVKGTDIDTAVESLRSLPEILLVDYNYKVQTSQMSEPEEIPESWLGNTQASQQWYLNYCGIPSGTGELTSPGGSPSVIVAVIDTGVDYDHEDLARNIWTNTAETPDNGIDDDGNGYVDDYYGVNIITGKGNGDDDNGHGTHVAGIIAAENNNLGTVGIAYNVKIMPIKAAMASGYLLQSDIAKAILYAYEHGAEVINMSFGGSACSIAVQDALSVAYTRCVLVASAGNDGIHNEGAMALPNYPAALTYVLGVMSVNQNGVESGFTNWDVLLYTNAEYELYAPGESILSPIPGDRYASWSGTSMAAPVVSAMAALLRSEYADRDTYPTKFIYGQLVATSEDQAICLDPLSHGIHNIPKIVNLYRALTVMPKPDVGMQSYDLFDTEGLEMDTAGVNSGEGVIDAGETIALGLTLRNRWGMSKDTIVTIDTLSSGGMADPYITIHNPSVNYGSVGTYSTGDCGKIYTGELLTGWENPFYITIAEDCPNDYIFTLNVTVSCGNALDEADTNTYTSTATIKLEVRNGTILPQIIEEDMVLTNDTLYIIPNSTVITEGTTVRVEPGTHIQFWSNDRDDPYAEDYIAYLRVEGRFLVNGTKENPVYIYPSDLMSNYVVDFGTYGNGVVELRYADVTNYNLTNSAGDVDGITYAYGCVFRQNYGGYMSMRYLSGGVVETNNYVSGRSFGTMKWVEDSVFYKCGSFWNGAEIEGTVIRCLFQDSSFKFNPMQGYYGNNITLRNCVFQGNYLVDHTASQDEIIPTSYIVGWTDGVSCTYVYSPASGSIYVSGASKTAEALIREYYGGQYAIFETEEELSAMYEAGMNVYTSYAAGIRYDEDSQTYLWYDGTPVGDFLLPLYAEGTREPAIYQGKLTTASSSVSALLEIPGPIVPDAITLPAYELQINTQETYQLAPICAPLALPAELLIFESSDEAVATVDETGLISPVGTGTAEVYIYSADRAVYNYVTVTVVDYVALESMALAVPEMNLEIGTTVPVDCLLSPADTTSRNVVWSSSDDTVATVDANGNVTAVGVGTARITASCSGLSAAAEVTVWKKTETISIQNLAATASVADGPAELPEVTVSENSSTVLYWESTDTDVAVIEDGKLVPIKAGTTTVKVTDLRSGLSDQILFYVTESAMPLVKKIMTTAYNGIYSVNVLYEDGVLYGWKQNSTQYGMLTGIRDFTAYRNTITVSIMAIREDGRVIFISLADDGTMTELSSGYEDFVDMNPVKIYSNDTSGCFVQLEDGSVYTNTHGNSYGQAGVGYTGTINGWAKVLIDEPIREVSPGYGSVLFLAESGNLYAAGGYTARYATPILIARNVTMVGNGDFVSNGCYGRFDGTEVTMTEFPWDYDFVSYSSNMTQPYAVRDSVIYDPQRYETDPEEVVFDGLSGIISLGAYQLNAMSPNFYMATSDGLLYHMCEDKLQVVALRPIENDLMRLTGTNLKGDVLDTDSISLSFSNMLTSANVALYEDGIQVSTHQEISGNVLTVTSNLGFAEDKTYRIVITPDSLVSDSGAMLAESVELSFAYVNCTETATELSIALELLTCTPEDAFAELPPVYATENAALDLVWTSSDPAVAEVIGGKLVIHRVGTTSLTVTDRNSGLSGSIPVFVTEEGAAEDALNLIGTNLNYSLLSSDTLELEFDKVLFGGDIVLTHNGQVLEAQTVIDGNRLLVQPVEGFEAGALYHLVPGETGVFGIGSEVLTSDFSICFVYIGTEEKKPVVRESQRDSSIVRLQDNFQDTISALREELQYNGFFAGNAILNRISTDTNVAHWFRPLADNSSTSEYPLGCNYWGTTDETAVALQIVDHSDYPTYGRILYAPYLTEAPENTFPFVTGVTILNKNGEQVTTVGNEEITVRVTFNRDMDTSIPLQVRFGSAIPYGDYEIEGSYVDGRTWEGKYTLTTLIENGNQFFNIANGCSAEEDLDFYSDTARFSFVIDTTAAQALIMQGAATDTGIRLTWTQDDFDTLMGYNVYRSTSEDGYYQRLNATVIPADTMEFFDDTVEPGVVYYYNFTVVKTDLTESVPSGKITIMSKDTMAPDLYHTPVYTAFTGSNLIISATVTDNLSVTNVKLHYRTIGDTDWKVAVMNKLNDKYSAIIPADQITTAGLEYYIEAADGINSTFKGSAQTPYQIVVQEAVDSNSMGDVNGDGKISNLDALMLLQAINDLLNLDSEQFVRADLNGDGVLAAAEALRILQYVSGAVGDLIMP